jgi:hypothetical protein
MRPIILMRNQKQMRKKTEKEIIDYTASLTNNISCIPYNMIFHSSGHEKSQFLKYK